MVGWPPSSRKKGRESTFSADTWGVAAEWGASAPEFQSIPLPYWARKVWASPRVLVCQVCWLVPTRLRSTP